jgi:hypothetical protein
LQIKYLVSILIFITNRQLSNQIQSKVLTRDQKLKDIYDFIRVDPKNIIEHSNAVDTKDFSCNENLTEENILANVDLFFSKDSHLENYLNLHGLVKLLNLCDLCGKSTHPYLDMIAKSFCNRGYFLPRDDDDSLYAIEKFGDKIDHDKMIATIIIKILLDNFKRQYPKSLAFCINFSQLDGYITHLVKETKNFTEDWGMYSFLTRFLKFNIDFDLEIDFNNLIEAIAEKLYPYSFHVLDFQDWIQKNNLDYSKDHVIKFVLYAYAHNLELFCTTVSQLKSNGFYDEVKHSSLLVNCIKNLARVGLPITNAKDFDNFFNRFVPFGVNLQKEFDDYIDGDSNLDILCVCIDGKKTDNFPRDSETEHIIRCLAKAKGLIR